MKTKTTIKFKNNYNRTAYSIGTRITTAQVPHRVGYKDDKTGIMFYQQPLDYDAWVWLVNRVRDKRNISPQDAARYVNSIYQSKLKTEKTSYSNLNDFILLLRNTCGKWFSVVPTMQVV